MAPPTEKPQGTSSEPPQNTPPVPTSDTAPEALQDPAAPPEQTPSGPSGSLPQQDPVSESPETLPKLASEALAASSSDSPARPSSVPPPETTSAALQKSAPKKPTQTSSETTEESSANGEASSKAPNGGDSKKDKDKDEEDNEPPLIDIVFFRHLMSTSNTVAPDGVVGQPFLRLSSEQIVKWAWDDVNQGTAQGVKRGEYLWDGLTKNAVDKTKHLYKIWDSVPDIYLVMSSPLTRAIQTGNLIFSNHTLWVHDCFQEATSWPQDFQACWYRDQGRSYTSYLQLKGGDGKDRGHIVKREKFDVTNAFFLSRDAMDDTRDQRLKTVLAAPTLEELEKRGAEARALLYDVAKKLHRQHNHNKTAAQSTGKLVVICHGGSLNFITQDFCCDFTRENDKSEWKWKTSSGLVHGDAVVYRFKPTADDKHRLVEQPETKAYRDALGDKYRVLKDKRREFKNPDGSVVDHKAEYMKFNEKVARDVKKTYEENPEVFRYLLGVPGPTIEGTLGTSILHLRTDDS
ncbi:hypothetical protein B0T10DRAFT_200905 [Thelonectria olida]|uniref:Uncharacterized protein n=1 Tax=Thelonectria olida TaxID=1576542 RepID=A0A9P9AIV2_9HYPO|nr:hypothetical protein B0T10DRAFT_200905 [Thelonectria olida]